MSTLQASRPRTPLAGDTVDDRVVRRRLGPGRRIPLGLLIGPVALLAAWFAGSASGVLDPRTLSAPWTVVSTAAGLIESGRLQESLATSAVRADPRPRHRGRARHRPGRGVRAVPAR